MPTGWGASPSSARPCFAPTCTCLPTGTFLIDVYLVREGRIVDAQNMPLIISKVGFGADIYKYANSRSIAQRFGYGVVAVLVALLTGWLAHLAFRKR